METYPPFFVVHKYNKFKSYYVVWKRIQALADDSVWYEV